MKIIVADITGGNAISMQSGSRLYELLYGAMSKSGPESVELDFSGVEHFASPFFNASIGLLLKDFSVDLLMEKITINNLPEFGLELVNEVIENAITYYDSKDQSARARQEIISKNTE